MKKKKKAISFLLASLFLGFGRVEALTIDNCEVVAIYKEYSSQDESNYICNKKTYDGNGISFSKDTIYLNNSNIYYLHIYKENIKLNITNSNNISLLNTDNVLNVTGTGSLRFKEANLVKKNNNGNVVYNYTYNNKTIMYNDITYEDTLDNFILNYDELKVINDLPEEYLSDNFNLINVYDYSKMTSNTINELWLEKNISTNLNKSIENGTGIIEYVPEDTKTLENENIVLTSNTEIKNYSLEINDLSEEEIATKVDDSLSEKELVNLYDVSVYKGKKEVSMKNGSYTIKIKMDNLNNYQDYQVIYVNDNGEIEEYIEPYIDGEYLVFTTTHLSQYGVIANEKELDVVVEQPKTSKKKIILSIYFFLIPIGIVGVILDFIYNTKYKKKKAVKRV